MAGFDDFDNPFDTSLDNLAMKLEQHSPTGNAGFSNFSRASSIGSVNAISCSSASSTHNTDDEDSDSAMMQTTPSYKDRRREAHTQAEQKRRDAIKKGYDELQTVVPTCSEVSSQKLSKATILSKTIHYIEHLMKEKDLKDEELAKLQKEVKALEIMKQQYEKIVKAHQNTPQHGQSQVSDECKFQVFQNFMDHLFQSFNSSISVASFEELSNCVFNWLEEHCKPNSLRELTLRVLSNSSHQLNR